MKNVIKLALARLSILGLIGYLQKIVQKMTGNPVFTTLAAKTTALDTAVTALETANTNYEAANSTAEQLMTLRDNAVVVAENAAKDLASAAEGVTKDPASLQGGGWDLASTHGSPPAATRMVRWTLPATRNMACRRMSAKVRRVRTARSRSSMWARSPVAPRPDWSAGRSTGSAWPPWARRVRVRMPARSRNARRNLI
jgi:hypothetical protein